MAIKTTVMWCALLVSVSGACDGLRVPRVPASGTMAESGGPQPPPRRASPRPAGSALPSGGESAEDEAKVFGPIRSGLRRLVAAEETFFAETGAYTDDLERLQFAPEAGTEVHFLWVSVNGWAASGTHPAIAGKDCVIFVGRQRDAPTTLKYVRKGREGVPVCDAPASPRPSTPAPAAVQKAANPVEETATTDTADSDTTNALDALNPVVAMKVDLRNLVRSQQAFFAQQGAYARSTEPFALQYLWHRGVALTILNADAESWAARATYVSRAGKSCVIWFGPVPTRPATAAEKRVADRAGVPVCDD